jgi:hypothetical protein
VGIVNPVVDDLLLGGGRTAACVQGVVVLHALEVFQALLG